jgi:hypothetical protein
VIPVEKIIRHPSYLGTQFDYDIALIKLARAPKVPYKTVEVPDADFGNVLNQPGVTTIVTGWGLQNGAQPSPELRQAQIQMLDRELCNNAMMEARAEEAAKGFSYAAEVFALNEADAYALWDELVAKAPMPMSENMICSGTFEGGKTSLQRRFGRAAGGAAGRRQLHPGRDRQLGADRGLGQGLRGTGDVLGLYQHRQVRALAERGIKILRKGHRRGGTRCSVCRSGTKVRAFRIFGDRRKVKRDQRRRGKRQRKSFQ